MPHECQIELFLNSTNNATKEKACIIKAFFYVHINSPLVLEAVPKHINGQTVCVLSAQDSFIYFPKSERREKKM